MERLIAWRVDGNLGAKFWKQMETVANEFQARYEARGISPIDTSALVERLETVAGKELADEIESAFTVVTGLYAEAGFALGYYTRANPDWLIFNDDTD